LTRSVYVLSPEGLTGKSVVALGILDALARTVGRVGVFRPLYDSRVGADPVLDLLLDQPGVAVGREDALGVDYEAAHRDTDEALATIVERFDRVQRACDAVVVLGSDYTDVSTGTELALNARIAANLGSPTVLVVHGRGRTAEEIRTTALTARTELVAHHARLAGVVANRTAPDVVEDVREVLATTFPTLVTGALADEPVLSAPTFGSLVAAVEGRLIHGAPDRLERESLGFVAAGMSLPNVLRYLRPDVTVITPSDRTDLLPGLVLAHQSGTFPRLAGLVLTGGYEIPDTISRLIEGVGSDLPIAIVQTGTFETAERLSRVHGPMTKDSRVKLDVARRIVAEQIDVPRIIEAIDLPTPTVTTPLMFGHQLMERARTSKRRIVLPESQDDRILEAADIVLRRGVADLVLLGEEPVVRARAAALHLDLDAAEVVDPRDPATVERFAAEYQRLRAHKGVTIDRAREVVVDPAYAGTMMVHLGLADGMVSGVATTTAHTIRPSLEFIKTKPGVSIVSSVFLMCLADRVLVYGDCAVNPDPTAEQLADIAISSAETARAFGIEPRVAMLSYSTGTSGSGADVDKVRAATELVAERAPDLPLEGPIQYDAAIDPAVARTKLPDSPVAGRATVFVFPDLNTGNNTYKAVQRSAHALAIGPVLQGLRKPVNDLSRGALVEDIVNTVVITAVQAQEETE
jgi:phosphate acetyltransferase